MVLKDEMKELSEKEAAIKKELQLMPRASRGEVQGMRTRFIIGSRIVRRQTRRYWLVSGTPVRLDKAIAMITGV